jgi:hypothetical protein
MFMILAVLPFITCNLVSLSSQCDEKSVPDINQMCIQPDYIQGCTLYKNIKECATCKQGNSIITQNILFKLENAN